MNTTPPSDAPPASYETRFTRLVGCRLPIQSAPMAGVVSDAELPVVQGIEAGGHPRGELGLLPLLEEVLAVATVPVVAAGGIGGPRAVAAVLAAGADAARAGTRFIAAAESRAHARYKQALVA